MTWQQLNSSWHEDVVKIPMGKKRDWSDSGLGKHDHGRSQKKKIISNNRSKQFCCTSCSCVKIQHLRPPAETRPSALPLTCFYFAGAGLMFLFQRAAALSFRVTNTEHSAHTVACFRLPQFESTFSAVSSFQRKPEPAPTCITTNTVIQTVSLSASVQSDAATTRPQLRAQFRWQLPVGAPPTVPGYVINSFIVENEIIIGPIVAEINKPKWCRTVISGGWMWLSHWAPSHDSAQRRMHTHTHWQHTIATVCKVQHAKPGWCTVTVTFVKQSTEPLVAERKRTSCSEEPGRYFLFASAFFFSCTFFTHHVLTFPEKTITVITHPLTQQLPYNHEKMHIRTLSQVQSRVMCLFLHF